MGVFSSKKLFAAPTSFIEYIKDDIEREMRLEQYNVESSKLLGGGYDISIAKGNIFKSVLGLKTALKIQIKPHEGSILVEAGVGIFGQQLIPSAITLFLFWPVIILQIWGIVKQQQLDDKIIEIASDCVIRHLSKTNAKTSRSDDKICPKCGERNDATTHFCTNCGEKL